MFLNRQISYIQTGNLLAQMQIQVQQYKQLLGRKEDREGQTFLFFCSKYVVEYKTLYTTQM
jgi:hypothetical protein